MYDDLVRRLRKCATEAGACKTCELDSNPSCTDVLMEQAADAIEHLIEECDVYRKAMTDEHNRAAKFAWEKEHCWIPVTERLPERFKSVLTVDKYGVIIFNWISGDGENWSTGYHITHWMPIPPAPKEE